MTEADASAAPAVPTRGGAWRWALFAWALGLVLYFWHKEGLIALPLLEPSARGGAFLEVLRNLGGPYRVWWGEIPYRELAISAAAIAAWFAIGWLLLGCFEVYLPLGAAAAMSLALGTGAAGVAMELATMAGALNRWTTVGVLGGMFVVFLGARAVARSRPLPGSAMPDTVLARRERRKAAASFESQTVVRPEPGLERGLYWLMAALVGVISLLVTLHAVAFPETYWDSLILYLGYARKMFLTGEFPTKVVGQVGIGLGANYPHLYPLLTAQTAAVAAYWSECFAQLLPPTAGLLTIVLAYYTVREITRDCFTAMACALLLRAVPYGLSYNQYASDYAVAIFYTAAFLYAMVRYVRDGLGNWRAIMLLMAAYAVHINYLMWALWIIAALAVVAAQWRWPAPRRGPDPDAVPYLDEVNPDAELPPRPVERPDFLEQRDRPGVIATLRSRGFVIAFVACAAVALPWTIRNVVVTGNPVYAFFNNIFPGIHVNPDVMKSAEVEWRLNGDGLAQAGATLGEKVRNSWAYFVTGGAHWKLAPVFVGFVLPGLLLALGGAALRRGDTGTRRAMLVATALFGLLWFYAYAVADYYLYQIIVVLPLFPLYMSYLFDAPRRVRLGLAVVAVMAGFAPGVIMGAMGFKLKKSGTLAWGEPFSQVHLTALRNLFMDRSEFLRLEFNGDMDMFAKLTWLPAEYSLLTHENRHLLLDERLTIVHLDDWEIQKAYDRAPAERVAILDAQRIGHYLYVPNEDRHRANSWLGMDELIGLGYFEEAERWPSPDNSTREGLEYKHIPADMNVLYKRTQKERPPEGVPAGGMKIEVKR